MADETIAKRDFRQEVTDSIVAMLEKGTAPWQKPWEAQQGFEQPFNPTSNRPYRGGNALHLMAVAARNGYQDPRWLTYRQAAESGWQVRKGEKGTHIEYWQFDETRQKAHDTEAAAEPGPPQQRRSGPIRRAYTVFNAQQIDGIPVHQRKQPTEWEVVKAGEQILQNSGIEISHDQRDRAFYNRAADSIHLPPTPKHAFPTPANYYGTALHEPRNGVSHGEGGTLLAYRFTNKNGLRTMVRVSLKELRVWRDAHKSQARNAA
jgi:antirestriction protein ArdC